MTSNSFIKGMNQDVHPKFQPEGSYRTALNAILESSSGELPTISNELGNELWASIPDTKKIIGHRLLNDGTTVLCLFDPSGVHEMGIFDPNKKTYTTVLSGCFNFNENHYVNIVYRLKNGCERILYLTDNYNYYRTINLDRPEYYTNGVTTTITSCELINYSRSYLHPNLSATVIDSGGRIQHGVYRFAYRLLDPQNNATDWFHITNPISIVDDSEELKNAPTTVNKYDGAVNVSTEIGYKVPANKSIRLAFSNVDSRFKYYQLAVIKHTTSSGAITGVDILYSSPIPANNNLPTTATFIYTGYDSQIENQTSLDEIFAERKKLHKVATHEIKDNKLFVANITDSVKDYTGFQRHASTIRTQWTEVSQDVDFSLSKNSEYYFGNGSFLYDEVYALGIVYVWKDGTISPTFHIPGRGTIDNLSASFGKNPYIAASTAWDTAPANPIDVVQDDKILNWEVYNSFTYFADEDINFMQGYMGYHEASTTYPNITICGDNHVDGYWGRDWQGNLITTSNKIRHHRMPLHAREANDEFTKRLGIKFTMTVNYPNPDIVGHYYVYGDRSFDKTVLDKGFLAPISSSDPANEDSFASPYLTYKQPRRGKHLANGGVNDVPIFGYISPKTLFDDAFPVGTYLKIEKYFHDADVNDYNNGGLPLTTADLTLQANTAHIQHRGWTVPQLPNHKLIGQKLLSKSSSDNTSSVTLLHGLSWKTIRNSSINTNVGLVQLDRIPQDYLDYSGTLTQFFSDGDGLGVSIKAYADVFNNLFSINYRRIGQNIFKKTGATLNTFHYDGDIFIGNLSVLDYWWYFDEGENIVKISSDFVGIVLESEINHTLRHDDDVDTPGKYIYYKYDHSNTGDAPSPQYSVTTYLRQKYYNPTENSFYFYPEYYNLNRSYNELGSITRYTALPANYDYCSSCEGTYPYRIYYSESDDIERRKDAFLTILPNNYTDIDGNNGGIVDMFTNFNELIVNTPYTPYIIPTNVQVLNTEDQTNVFIGSGKVFQIPPKPLKNSDVAFGGINYWKSRVSTEYGNIWVDDTSNRVLLLSDKLNDITLAGMRNFWQENATISLNQQFKLLTGQDYPFQTTVHDKGVGYITTYDSRHKRVIVHKKDYRILDQHINNFIVVSEETTPSNPFTLWFNGLGFYYNGRPEENTIPVEFGNVEFFENKSFTMSYSFLTNSWISFHSYFPYYMFNDVDSYYTNNLYKHDQGNYQTYYGSKYDHMLDIVAVNSPVETKLSTNITFATNAALAQSKDIYYPVDATFDRIIFYNSNQSSGYQNILPKSVFNLNSGANNVYITNVDNKWRINDIRDLAADQSQSVWTNNWANIAGNYWIDKVPNNIDYFKSLFELRRFRDYYLGVRLFSKSANNLKINTDIIQTYNANRNR